MLEIRVMQSALSLSLLAGPLRLEEVAPDWVLSIGLIELFAI